MDHLIFINLTVIQFKISISPFRLKHSISHRILSNQYGSGVFILSKLKLAVV